MKKKLLIVIVLLASVPAIAQKKKNPGTASDTSLSWTMYRNAREIGDPDVAKTALYQILARNPNCTACYDSLAQIYFALGNYPQAITCADKAGPDSANTRLLELKAYALRNSGDLKESLRYFEKLRAGSNNPEYAYQTAAIQYNLQMFGECIMTCSSVINNKDAANRKVVISYESGKAQEIAYTAAAYNLRGVAFQTTRKKDKAREDFEAALKIEPDFLLPKNNLEALAKDTE